MTPRSTAYAVMGAVLGGMVLLAVHPVSRFYPACPVYAWFHVLCPGCGATRALTALLRGDLVTAWRRNALFVVAVPFLVWYGGGSFWLAVRAQRIVEPRIPSAVLCVSAVVTVIFTLGRNL
jgi:hypothetical protein